MDSVRRADGDALTAEAALGVVDVGEVVGYGDGLKLTLLEAERAADTGIAAGLLSDPTLVLIDAADEDATALGPLLTQLDDVLRAGLDAGTAGYALILEDDRQARLGVHVHSVEVTRVDAVRQAQTAPATVGVALVECGRDGTAAGTVIDIGTWARVASTITAHDGDQRILLLGGDTEDAADLLHDGGTADGAEEPFEGLTLTAGASEGGASREATAPAVGLREDFSDLRDAGVFLDLELA